MTTAAPGPLALVGGAELQPGNEEQDRMLADAARGGPGFVLATAAARQRPDLAVAHAIGWFGSLGLGIEELPATRRADVRSEANAARALEGRLFYLVGGDPGLVTSTLGGSAVWEAVLDSWRRGAALAGSSAGAMALGEWTLLRGRRPGGADRRFRAGLGVIPRVAVIPHFDTFGSSWVDGARRTAPGTEVVLVGLDERTAAIWHDGAWRAAGPGRVVVMRGGATRAFRSGDAIDAMPAPRTTAEG